jgi:nucleoside-diphosphate-sugar epimerase
VTRILVCGSRGWNDGHAVYLYLRNQPRDAVIVHGACASGADRHAWLACQALGLRQEQHPADWKRFGKRAGFIRNDEMLDSGIDRVAAFWDGESRGTKHTIEGARKRGIPTFVVTSERFEVYSGGVT